MKQGMDTTESFLGEGRSSMGRPIDRDKINLPMLIP